MLSIIGKGVRGEQEGTRKRKEKGLLVTANGLVSVESGSEAVKGLALGELELVLDVQGNGTLATAGRLVVYTSCQ